MEKEVIANTSSLIFIAKINRFDLVKNIFTKIIVPKEVINEIFDKDKPENTLIKKEINTFIQVENVKEIREFSADKGERAAISLCLEKKDRTFLSDDKKARKIARSLEIDTLGILGILLWNLENKYIAKQEFEELINDLMKNGYYITSNTYTKLIEKLK